MYKVVDLFAGCGGGAVGIENTNKFKTILAIDNMQCAVDSYNDNLKDKVAVLRDITTLTEEDYKELTNYETVDVLMGSPPCVGFSMITRRNNTFYKTDRESKNSLVYYYLMAVKALQPKVCVIENVVGLLSMKNKSGYLVIDEIAKAFYDLGYVMKYQVVSVDKIGGVQKRKRVIIIACKTKEMLDKFNYPEETENNLTIRDVIGKYENLELNKDINHITTNLKSTTIERIKIIKPGHSILSVPDGHYLKTRAKFSNSYERLVYENKCNTLPNICKTMVIHPVNDRILSVREGLALQGFSDNYKFNHNITAQEQYLMVGNAIPPILTERVFEKIYEILESE